MFDYLKLLIKQKYTKVIYRLKLENNYPNIKFKVKISDNTKIVVVRNTTIKRYTIPRSLDCSSYYTYIVSM